MNVGKTWQKWLVNGVCVCVCIVCGGPNAGLNVIGHRAFVHPE